MAVDDREYLRQMYQAGLNNGAYQNVAIGIHPGKTGDRVMADALQRAWGYKKPLFRD